MNEDIAIVVIAAMNAVIGFVCGVLLGRASK